MQKIELIGRDLVTPAKATWSGPMPLTESDQIGVLMHQHVIYFYKPPPKTMTTTTIVQTLKTSLTKLLVHFYPVAGRLRWLPGSRLELDCNAKGVLFLQAYSHAQVSNILSDLTTAPVYFPQLSPHIDYVKDDIRDIPIIAAQLTEFRCGGVALSFAVSHAVADGRSAAHFLSEWARLARGEDSLLAAPLLDRRLLRAGDPPPSEPPRFDHPELDPLPLLLGESSDEREKIKATAVAILKVTRAEVEILRDAANRGRLSSSCTTRAYSRHEAMAGHVWRCACRARRLAAEQPTALFTCVDVRRRVGLPDEFFGNAIVDVVARGAAGEVVGRPLGYAAGKIREAVERVTGEYVYSGIDFVKRMEDLSDLQDLDERRTKEGEFYGNPNLGVVSWTAFPNLRGLDFGWGAEMLVAPASFDCDGDTVVLPGYDGDGSLMVALCLQVERMEDFKRFFYQHIHDFPKMERLIAIIDCN